MTQAVHSARVQGANRSHAEWHCEDLQRRRRVEGVLSCAEISVAVYQRHGAIMQPNRRQFMAAGAATAAAAPLGAQAQGAARPAPLRPRRLQRGDTLALINPSGAIYERAHYGHFAGTDAQRASDVNAMFADPDVHGILAMTGGSGGHRILPLLDYELIRRNPKFLGAFTKCDPGDGRYGTLTLDEVFDDYFKPLNVPVYSGAMFGHIKRKFTLPVGLEVELNADAGTLRLLRPAVL